MSRFCVRCETHIGSPPAAVRYHRAVRSRLEAAKLEGRHFGEASCRDFRESLLHVLPHAWSDPLDTELAEARFVKHRPGRGAHKEGLGQAGQALAGQRAKRTASATAGAAAAAGGSRPPRSSGLIGLAQGLAGRAGSSSSSHHSPTQAVGGQGQGGRHSSAHKAVGSRAPHHHANISANAIVAYLEEGVEVVHLYSGRSICALHLQPGQLHADLNGDGVLDHVQVGHRQTHCHASPELVVRVHSSGLGEGGVREV
ncbi:hypothetical protein QJQ45_021914 [Haematococcus lacustris]|nr:hypothetical protein QJQ45_021914 [Haematococcus lacustris]